MGTTTGAARPSRSAAAASSRRARRALPVVRPGQRVVQAGAGRGDRGRALRDGPPAPAPGSGGAAATHNFFQQPASSSAVYGNGGGGGGNAFMMPMGAVVAAADHGGQSSAYGGGDESGRLVVGYDGVVDPYAAMRSAYELSQGSSSSSVSVAKAANGYPDNWSSPFNGMG